MTTKIEWTDITWNPTTGCKLITPGCANCYARTMHKRLQGMGLAKYADPFETVRCHAAELERPFKWQKPKMVFVNSMSDLFHEDIPDAFVENVFYIMRESPRHIYQVLTKRPERAVAFFRGGRKVPDNVWLGVSVENVKHGIPRVAQLLKIKAKTRFLSCEPLLGDIAADFPNGTDTGIHWIIVGGETGKNARPMHPDWAHNILVYCRGCDIPFFFKQWGAHGGDGKRRNKKANGRILNGREYNEMPEMWYNHQRLFTNQKGNQQ